jgi:hypothetical protein
MSDFKRENSFKRLTVAILITPLGLFLSLYLNYSLVNIACGIQNKRWLIIVSAASVACCAAGIYLSLKKIPPKTSSREEKEIRFISLLTVFVSILFLFVISGHIIANFLFNPCER